tara:strand:+ start:275 stop:670 length:396 start_codon:yes stop_codon:yes gene_type:complete
MIEEVPNIITNGFKVLAKSIYVPEMCDFEKSEHFFAYLIRIYNESKNSAILRKRYWKITDGFGNNNIVQGEGVIGEQPRIKPGKYHAYSSYCPLKTPFGYMEGHYTMEGSSGEMFDIKIPKFQLVVPSIIN